MSELVHGSAVDHARALTPVLPRSRRRCYCGCRGRATHYGTANGVALICGCEFYVRRWVADWRARPVPRP